MSATVVQPIFFIGMPRSGTTVTFELFARHEALAWTSNYCRMFPGWPGANFARRLLDNSRWQIYGRKKPRGALRKINYLLPHPDEAYAFWDTHSQAPFSRGDLSDRTATEEEGRRLRTAVAKVQKWQGRERFAAKLTGPPRIRFLTSVFPDAIFIHLIRDGRAVVRSLLRVPFWREFGGFDAPFWEGLVTDEELHDWQRGGADQGLLAGLQWRRVIQLSRAEAAQLPAGRYHEFRYEALSVTPHETLSQMFECAGLRDSQRAHDDLDSGPRMRNMNRDPNREYGPDYVLRLNQAMQPMLAELGYA